MTDQLRKAAEQAREALEECADDLEAYTKDEYGWPDVHLAMERKYLRDMEQVVKARSALAALDAALAAEDGRVIALTPAEIQSGLDRVRWAELLIRQLPPDHDGRNSWLLNYARAEPEPLAADTPATPSDAELVERLLRHADYNYGIGEFAEEEDLRSAAAVIERLTRERDEAWGKLDHAVAVGERFRDRLAAEREARGKMLADAKIADAAYLTEKRRAQIAEARAEAAEQAREKVEGERDRAISKALDCHVFAAEMKLERDDMEARAEAAEALVRNLETAIALRR